MMKLLICLPLLFLLASKSVATLQLVQNPTAASCTSLTFSASGTTQNKKLLGVLPPLNSPAFLDFLRQDNGFIDIDRTYNLTAQYCTPAIQHPTRNAPLLVFVHGVSYDLTYMGGLRTNPVSNSATVLPYSWVDYATKQGYYTLSIDRLGSGRSDKPNSLLEVQAPLQAALIADVIENEVRTVAFDHVTYVGHSYGSIVGTYIARDHPDLLDALIFTGIAQPNLDDQFAVAVALALPVPAIVYNPVRFPPTLYDPGYIFVSSRSGREGLFYTVPGTDFDPAVSTRDYNTAGAIAAGELATVYSVVASGYTGPVFVMTGDQDAVFCGGTPGAADCMDVSPNKVDRYSTTYFPNAGVRGSFLQENSGHCNILHYSWESGVVAAHQWLEAL